MLAPAPAEPCIWCLQLHLSKLLLCPSCDSVVAELRRRAGLPVRGIPTVAVKEEPDD